MATVVLQYAGAALGTLLGGPIGGIIGRAAGAIAGSMLDQAFFGSGGKRIEGPRLSDTRVMSSTEGAPIPRLWGRARLAGQVIWATNLKEETETDTASATAKGGPKTESVSYSYYANFAVALCEGPISRIGRVWADGKEIDISDLQWRLHKGTEDQEPDSLILAKEGDGMAPAYRGVAYVVFQHMPLEDYGNRIPQLSFEVTRAAGGAESLVRAVNIIPGSSEFGYDTKVVTEERGGDETRTLNATAASTASDWTVSLDDLTDTCSNLQSAALVVAWFGDDLRCAECRIRPAVEVAVKTTEPETWQVAGVTRAAARLVSQHDGGPAYGGTPSDLSVIRALRDLKNRGLKPVFYPFVLMDIAASNTLPDPYGGGSQPPYPWRGRITCNPAPGQASSPDNTAACATQVSAFMGTARVEDFTISGNDVVYAGPGGWGYRRMILHYAHLCKIAGNVDAFLIGSELRGLTTLRAAGSTFPFVQALCELAADVKTVLPDARVSYAADWSEYSGHQPTDGSGDVHFHLDSLWADANIDFVGIDNYMPLADWRDGASHLDLLAGSGSIYDIGYLQLHIAGGEDFDWYYASDSDRAHQIRTSISDGAYGKPWIFRRKDLVSWWTNPHHDRRGGVEMPTATAWVPQSKPIWFTEAGCPAIDRGANQPNAFVDAKSSESLVPRFSRGWRDDFMQNRYVTALTSYWQATGAHNPISSVYGGTMLDASRMHFWAWDARPFPRFPLRTDIWADGINYDRGHWLNGRIAAVPVATLLTGICASYGLSETTAESVEGLIDGFVLDRVMSAREALEALAAAFAVDVVESGRTIAFRSRRATPSVPIAADALVEHDAETPLFRLTRSQDIDLPRALKLSFVDGSLDYRRAAVAAIHSGGGSARETVTDLACVTTQAVAQVRADIALQERWSGRETLDLTLPPSFARLEPGDRIGVMMANGVRAFRIEQVTDAEARRVTARSHDVTVYDAAAGQTRHHALPELVQPGRPDLVIMDPPLAETGMLPAVPWMAVNAKPWIGAIALSRYVSTSATRFNRLLPLRATKGRLTAALPAGPADCYDRANALCVKLDYGGLQSVSEDELLQGANAAAIGTDDDGWEIIQFAAAELIAAATYRLSVLLRGQAGSDPEIRNFRPAGARFVLLNAAVVQPVLNASQGGLTIKWKAAPRKQVSPQSTRIVTHTGRRLGLRPRAPAQLRWSRDGNDIVITWIRRTRIDGDSWEADEVPLGEDSERYSVDILDGATLRRTAIVSEPLYRYAAPARLADLPPGTPAFDIRICQISAAYGCGAPLLRTIHV